MAGWTLIRTADTRLQSMHNDFVHDVAFDFYGKRLATCSADHVVRVWNLKPSDGSDATSKTASLPLASDSHSAAPGDEAKSGDPGGQRPLQGWTNVGGSADAAQTTGSPTTSESDLQWTCVAELKDHSAPVTCVHWAHPAFGQLIASSSADRKVHVFEEQVETGTGKLRWISRTTLSDSREAVTCVQFAPRHQGLKLATSARDGWIRVYEFADAQNLAAFDKCGEFRVESSEASSVSWNSSPFDPIAFAVSHKSGATIFQAPAGNPKAWDAVCSLPGLSAPVTDVDWARNLGRTYHLIATASRDTHVRIYKVVITPNPALKAVDQGPVTAPDNSFGASSEMPKAPKGAAFAGVVESAGDALITADANADAKGTDVSLPSAPSAPPAPPAPPAVPLSHIYKAELIADLTAHDATVWRVKWDVTGTVLASAGDDGSTRTWIEGRGGVWVCSGVALRTSSQTPLSGLPRRSPSPETR